MIGIQEIRHRRNK